MTNQLMFGESYQVLEKRKKWLRIKLDHDGYEAWIDKKQFTPISQGFAEKITRNSAFVSTDLIEILSERSTGNFFPIFIGSVLPLYNQQNQSLLIEDKEYLFSGPASNTKTAREHLKEIAFQYLNAPYLWGGRTPFGIDCSGFTQMVYRICGYSLPRDSKDQAKEGYALSFIEESEPGDLAFFDNEEGEIIHVGLILEDNYIIHASGKVRLDRLDQTGIFNAEERNHTHKLRVIKKVI